MAEVATILGIDLCAGGDAAGAFWEKHAGGAIALFSESDGCEIAHFEIRDHDDRQPCDAEAGGKTENESAKAH